MSTLKISTGAIVCVVFTLASCAPKATPVEQTPTIKKEEKKEMTPVPPIEPELVLPDDGLRMGDQLAMPKDTDFRATNPTSPRNSGDSGAVIARPPTDPPSRVKPPTGE